MVTRLGTILGTTLGTDLGAFSDAISAEQAYAALLPFSWLRADSFTQSAGKVTAFVDKANGSHWMMQGTSANQVVTPAPDAGFKNQLTATFVRTSATRYTSSLAASTWTFAHSGSGCTIINVVRPIDSNASRWLMTKGTSATEIGINISSFINGAPTVGSFGVQNATTIVINVISQGTSILNVPTYMIDTYLEGATPNEWSHEVLGSPVRTGVSSAAPAVTAPAATLTLGNLPTGGTASALNGQWAESTLFNRVLSAGELNVVKAYLASQYGL